MIPPGLNGMIRLKLSVNRTAAGYSGSNWGFTRTLPGQTGLTDLAAVCPIGITVHPGNVPFHPGGYHF